MVEEMVMEMCWSVCSTPVDIHTIDKPKKQESSVKLVKPKLNYDSRSITTLTNIYMSLFPNRETRPQSWDYSVDNLVDQRRVSTVEFNPEVSKIRWKKLYAEV
ncbi:hypothetical protein Ahia01_000231100, partial [Argonauta hians]